MSEATETAEAPVETKEAIGPVTVDQILAAAVISSDPGPYMVDLVELAGELGVVTTNCADLTEAGRDAIKDLVKNNLVGARFLLDEGVIEVLKQD